MYAGTTFRKTSGNVVGVHQKIDRIARIHLASLIKPTDFFPPIKQIIHFEGNNGPDGIKRKSPSKDEPWHYIDPTKPEDVGLITIINDHVHNLGVALQAKNEERAAFEAAWLAHSIVDGLTPAHHFPLGDKIEELWGKPHHERLTKKDKNIIKGVNRRDTFSKMWEYWGAKGVFSSHLGFELGIASMITPLKFKKACPTTAQITRLKKDGFELTFMKALTKIDNLKLYDAYNTFGWTRQNAIVAKKVLIPTIIQTVCLAWYFASLGENA
jgi:hypothetical protein